ncbi:uncharacterized protein LOC101698902 isoform X5 [Heterocephalus glaber]|uniref:Uncharacterized protein LOC101698902 isoform X5 n=1 Tax=Heterocephalus glaber TaxID=10181 RepID=A0AAX6RTF2_HETGA|nr:uncharacterized protein LOC101698902 isoform X5 [Heterocephalus glaber]
MLLRCLFPRAQLPRSLWPGSSMGPRPLVMFCPFPLPCPREAGLSPSWHPAGHLVLVSGGHPFLSRLVPPGHLIPPKSSLQLAFSTMAVTLAGQAEGLRTEVTGRTHRSHCPRLLHSLLPSPPSWFGPKLPPLGNLRGTGLRIPCLAPQCPPAPNRQMRMEGPASQTGFTPVTCAHPLEMSGKHNGQVFCLQSFRLNLFKFFIVWDWDTQECLHSHGDAQRTFPRERLDPEILDRASP